MALVKPPTPDEFSKKMKEIKDEFYNMKGDQEECHEEMDDYICQALESLGYHDGIRIFRTTPKWYA